MPLLPDFKIQQLAKQEQLIAPYWDRPPDQSNIISSGLTSYGYDLTLGYDFKIFHPTYCGVIDPKDFSPENFIDHSVSASSKKPITVPPNSFCLARSLETLKIPRRVLAICLGKSTYARCGIIVNVTPLEPEWEGVVTIEISNTAPLPALLYPGEGIAQVLFFSVPEQDTCVTSYADKKGRYQGQSRITLPFVTNPYKPHRDFKIPQSQQDKPQ